MESYEAILNRMEEAYRQKSGHVPEAVSDLGLRLRVLAGELYRLQAGMDWLRRQAFPQTATGEQLDLHGAQRGLARKGASRAQGAITFTRYLPLTFDLVIPKGTVCAAPGEAAVEYETLADGVLTAGSLTVEIPAQAVLGGKEGNAAAGFINTLITPVTGVDYVVNKAAFTGGGDPEGDEGFRARLLDAYRRWANSGNAGFYQEIALGTDGVTSAQAVPREDGAGTVGVYVWGNGAVPEEGVISRLKEELGRRREIGVTVTVKPAQAAQVNVFANLRLQAGADFQQGKLAVESALREWFAQRQVGDPVYLAQLSQVVLGAAPVERLDYAINMQDVEPSAGTIPVLGTVMLGELS